MIDRSAFMLTIAVDVVLLRLSPNKKQLQFALIKRTSEPFNNMFALPGGVINKNIDQDLEQAALRILQEKTPIENIFLEQVGTVGNNRRDPRGFGISVVYFALLNVEQASAIDKLQNNNFTWIETVKIDQFKDKIAFDHVHLIKMAIERAKAKTCYSSLPVHLMPKTFTLTQLQQVYEIILGSKIDKRSFRRKIEQFDILVEDENLHVDGAHRPAQLYKISPKFSNSIAISNKNFETF